MLDYTSTVYVENVFQYSPDFQETEFVGVLLCMGSALTPSLAGWWYRCFQPAK